MKLTPGLVRENLKYVFGRAGPLAGQSQHIFKQVSTMTSCPNSNRITLFGDLSQLYLLHYVYKQGESKHGKDRERKR